jgi:hypothetical protein
MVSERLIGKDLEECVVVAFLKYYPSVYYVWLRKAGKFSG